MLEKKKHTKPYFCKRLFKLVFVLFNLQKAELSMDEIWRQLQMQYEDDDDQSQANSSMLAGVASDVQSNYMSTINEKALQVPPNLKTVEKESEEHYSNFKAANANLFSLSSSNNQHLKHTSLSPKVRTGATPTEMSPAHRKYHSGLNKVESKRVGETMETSPAILEKGKVKKAVENADLSHSKTDLDQNNASSQATFLNKRHLNQENESLAYEDDYSM